MNIYKLTPTDVESERWESSEKKCEIIVRAASEDEAREIANQVLLKATELVPGGDTPEPPWTAYELVTCERLEDSEYAEDGPAGVLSPDCP